MVSTPTSAEKTAAGPSTAVLTGLLFSAAFLVFLPALRNDFIWYDDNGYVTRNEWVQQGFTWANIVHAFRTTEIAYWHPLTWMSHMLDVELFGLSPRGHHFTSVLLHAINTGLVFVVLRKLTGAIWRSAMVAALFGLHPLHVESVAWVAERKDVLSTLFTLVALWSYAAWARPLQGGASSRRTRFYVASLLSFCAGLMSKPMVVTLPCVLLVLDYWPLRRWSPASGESMLRHGGRLLAEKLPFFALSALTSVATIHAQKLLGTVQSSAQLSVETRLINATVAYGEYLEKCFFPRGLAVFYPYTSTKPVSVVVIAMLILAGFSAVAVLNRNRRPYLLVGWLLFLGTLVPVIGLVQVGGQAMADRYSYVPLIGIFIVVVWSAADLATSWSARRYVLGSVATFLLLALSALTFPQIGFWKNTETLFRHALEVTDDNATAHDCLGYYYAQNPATLANAIAEYRQAVKLAPNAPETHFSLGAVLARQPETLPEAVSEYDAAIRLRPKDAPTLIARALALEQLPTRSVEAIQAYRAALKLAPEHAEMHNRLGNLLAQEPDHREEAIAEYRETLRLQPGWVEVHLNLGGVLAEMPGRLSEAIAEYEIVLRAKPDFAEAHNNLGNALAATADRAAEAGTHYEAALRLRADYFEAHFNYGRFLSTIPGRDADAIAHLEAGLRLQPDVEPARALLAQLHARRGGR